MSALAVQRLPQYMDRVEVIAYHYYGTVKLASVKEEGGVYSFFIELDDTFCGWFTQDELRVCEFGPASDPANYGD